MSHGSVGAQAEPGVVLGALRILVVDDDSAVRDMTTTMLADSGYSTASAKDGDTALRMMEGFRPDLVVTDLNMPRMSGFELLEVLRRRFPQLPVIATSGEFAGDALPPGVIADAFLSKCEGGMSRLQRTVGELLSIGPMRAGAHEEHDNLDQCDDADLMRVFARLGTKMKAERPVGLGVRDENPTLQAVSATSTD